MLSVRSMLSVRTDSYAGPAQTQPRHTVALWNLEEVCEVIYMQVHWVLDLAAV